MEFMHYDNLSDLSRISISENIGFTFPSVNRKSHDGYQVSCVTELKHCQCHKHSQVVKLRRLDDFFTY